jgi:predicted RNA binding protein YcfA (HicA-like mRNA interferase family)
MLRDSRDVITRLNREGFALLRVSGSHHQFRNPATGRTVTVPHPRKDLPAGTVQSIYRQAGWPRD